jgi:hypothetical protein
MTDRFVYYQRVTKSKWPFLFKVLGNTIFDAKNTKPSPERIAKFEDCFLKGDLLADNAIKELFNANKNHSESFKLMHQVLDNGINNELNIPPSFKKLIQEINTDPTWLNRRQLEYGAAVCRRLGDHAMAVLGDLALLGGYSNPDISKPLTFTGALKGEQTFDRISETSQFWVDVTRKNALEIGAKGYKIAIRVRMMHAMVRMKLLRHPNWDNKKWGWPINEADSLATNVGFSMAMIFGCKLLGFYLPNKDIEAVLHLWRYIGFLMGDDTDWLPKTTEEGLQCLQLIHLSNNNIPDDESKALALDYLKSFEPKKNEKNWKKYLNDYYYFQKHKAYSRYLIPPDLYRNLNLPPPNLSWLLVPMVEMPFIFVKDRLRLLFPSLNHQYESIGAKQQEDVIKSRMGEKKSQYIPKEKMAK